MYGEGFLRNLSVLAQESDDYKELVQNSIFQPFLSSVEYFSCGLQVFIPPYRNQTISFWKEMLKQLMHSMSMALIRDKAVKSFLERIQGSRPIADAAGWLELRKGYHTYLSVDGNLIIYRADVLDEAANAARGNTGKTTSRGENVATKEERVFKLPVQDGLISIEQVQIIGNWHIHVELSQISSTSSTSHYDDLLQTSPTLTIAGLLPGWFQYQLLLPANKDSEIIELVLFQDHSARLEARRSRFSKMKSVSKYWPTALMKMDMRLKSGLPILLPKDLGLEGVIEAEDTTNPEAGLMLMELTYQYISTDAHKDIQQHDHTSSMVDAW
jgi:hypothetical protein